MPDTANNEGPRLVLRKLWTTSSVFGPVLVYQLDHGVGGVNVRVFPLDSANFKTGWRFFKGLTKGQEVTDRLVRDGISMATVDVVFEPYDRRIHGKAILTRFNIKTEEVVLNANGTLSMVMRLVWPFKEYEFSVKVSARTRDELIPALLKKLSTQYPGCYVALQDHWDAQSQDDDPIVLT